MHKEIRKRKKEQAKQDAKTKFLQEQALWRDSEKQRKLEGVPFGVKDVIDIKP